jgi:hypothetical protein
MIDDEFLERFERCDLDEFHHRDHVRLAWLYLRAGEWDDAVRRIRDGIRRFAVHHGASRKYHETITIAWLAVVAAAIDASPDVADFDAFLATHERLLDPGALRAHYSPELLASDRARAEWVEPDLEPIPAHATSEAMRNGA